MAISNTNPEANDVVFIQRDESNSQYNETHILGAGVILHINGAGYMDADNSASFYAIYPPPNTTAASSVSASWASQSLSASYAHSASWAPPQGLTAYAISASWASASATASAFTVVIATVTGSYPVVFVRNTGSQTALLDDQVLFYYNPGTDTVFVPNFSASGEVVVPLPINPQDAATKQYVDSLVQFGIDFYFRSASADVPTYNQMLSLATPLSGSIYTFTSPSVVSDSYLWEFISPALNIPNIDPGKISVTFNAYSLGGSGTPGIHPEIYIRNTSSVETEIGSGNDITLNAIPNTFTNNVTITSSYPVNPSDRMICKFKSSNTISGNPTFYLTVDGNSGTGITVPISVGNFVPIYGGSMTGPLTNSYGFYGTASNALQALQSLSTSFFITSNNPLPVDQRTVVADNIARDSIPLSDRYIGLTVWVIADSQSYTLIGGLNNLYWVATPISASFATTAAFSVTSSFALNGGGGGGSANLLGSNNYVPVWWNNNLTTGSLIYATNNNIGINTPNPVASDTFTVTEISNSIVLWTPTLLSITPRFWYKGDAITDVSASYLNVWPDSSTYKNHATASSPTAKPLLVYNQLNGYPSVRFDGVNDSMHCLTPSSVTSSVVTAFVVAKVSSYASSTSTSNVGTIIGNSSGSINRNLVIGEFFDGGTSKFVWSLFTKDASSNYGVETPVNPYNAKTGEWYINTVIVNGAASSTTLYLSGSASGSGASNQSTNLDLRDLYIGHETSSNQPFNGDIAEIVILTSSLSAADQSRVEGYLAWKYGLQGSLPAAHTYKSTMPTPTGYGNVQVWKDYNGNTIAFLSASGILYATSSYAISASWAPGAGNLSSSWSSQSYWAISASFASQSISASYATQASTSFLAVSASWAPTGTSNFAISASWASMSFAATSASYSSGSSYAISSSWASQSYFNVSSSWASASFIATSASFASASITSSFSIKAYSSSYALTASWMPMGRSIVLCGAYTPTSTGADAAEVSVPFSPMDGSSSMLWNIRRLSFRVQISESNVSTINIEKSSVVGAFSPSLIGSVSLTNSFYENYTTGSLGSTISGDKLRFNVTSLGTAQNWTIITEIAQA